MEQSHWPIVMATTASLGPNPERIHQTFNDLQIELVELRTEMNPDVTPYIDRIDVEWRQVDLPNEYKEIGEILRKILWKRLSKLQFLVVIKKNLKYITRRDLLDIGVNLRKRLENSSEKERGPFYGAIMLQAASLTLFHSLGLLETQWMYSFKQFIERMEKNSQKKEELPEYSRRPKLHFIKKSSCKSR